MRGVLAYMIDRITKIASRALRLPQSRIDARWYENAGGWCNALDADFDLPLGTCAGYVAALSPLNTWEDQLRFTPPSIAACIQLIRAGNNPITGIRGPGFLANRDKASRILQGESPLDVLGGDKVRAFYRALCGDYSTAVIDRHAVAIAGYTGKGLSQAGVPTPRLYERLTIAYKFAGERVGLNPCEIQAVTWCYWRRTNSRFAAANVRKGH